MLVYIMKEAVIGEVQKILKEEHINYIIREDLDYYLHILGVLFLQ